MFCRWGYPSCQPCECSLEGSSTSDGRCDPVTGQCPCRGNFGGRQCETCTPGNYDYPNCYSECRHLASKDIQLSKNICILLECDCDSIGSTRMSCSDTGVCDCKPNFVGKQCDECAPDRFNYPLCEECNCNPDGVTETFFTLDGGCAEVPKGELCTCKAAVTGRICDTCKPLFWNLRAATPEGCEACECNRNGTIGMIGLCDQLDGQCACKAAVGGTKCRECQVTNHSALSGHVTAVLISDWPGRLLRAVRQQAAGLRGLRLRPGRHGVPARHRAALRQGGRTVHVQERDERSHL